MISFPDAPIIGERYPASGSPAFQWDGIKWVGVADVTTMSPSNGAPLVDGAATPGALTLYQRGDHAHPTDGSRAPTVNPAFSGGMWADSVVANNFGSNANTYANGGSIISQISAEGGQPTIGCYSWDRGYVMGLMLDVNNRIAVANMWGDGLPVSNPANLDIYGNLYLATTMLVSRDPTGGLDVATKNYVDTRSISGSYMPLSGAQMSGQFYANPTWGSLMGNPAPSIEIRGNNCDAYMTFHRAGYFACNFGMSSDWNFWMGGWSFGAGAAYRFWTTRDFGGLPVTDTRFAFCTDHTHTMYSALAENWGGAVITGQGAMQAYVGHVWARYRYLQALTSSWWTVGYA